MTSFQIVMLLATAFFAYKIYEFVQNMEDPTTRRREADPEDTARLVELADDAYEAGELGKAKALLSEADVLSPDSPEILNKLGFILAKEGDPQRPSIALPRTKRVRSGAGTLRGGARH